MGLGTDRYTADSITREQQDEFSARSNERAAAAIKDGRLDDEIVPVEVPQRKGDPVLVEHDEGVRPGTTAESLAKLRPAFDPDGTITAGNASQLSDAGSAVVLMSKAEVARRGVAPARRVRRLRDGRRAGQRIAAPPAEPGDRPGRRSRPGSMSPISICSRSTRRSPPSASPPFASSGIGADRVNVNGGAIALGHPIGMSGNRLALTLLHELRRRGGGIGAAALCGGGGQGDAAILRAT